MQARVGIGVEWGTQMVNRQRSFGFFLLMALAWPMPGWCDAFILESIPAGQIEKECNLDFYAIEGEHPTIGRADHSVELRWACHGQPARVVDNFEIEGGSPNIVTVFYRERRDVIVLVKWSPNSQAGDVQGDYYKVYVYRHVTGSSDKPFFRRSDVMKKLGEGWDGTMYGKPVHYPYKDASAIRKAFNCLGY